MPVEQPSPDALVIWTGLPTDQQGASESCWVAIAGNERAAIGKRNNPSNGNAYIVCNEIIAYRVAQQVGLPMPDGFVHRPAGAPPFFVQLNFNPQGDRPPPVNAQSLASQIPDLAALLVIFDSLILNTDRHSGNVMHRQVSQHSHQVYVFDHSHALFGGRGHAPGSDRLKRSSNWLGCDGVIGNRQCLLPWVADAVLVDAAVAKIQAIPDAVFHTAVLEARSCGLSEQDGELVNETLRERRDGMATLVLENRQLFRNISQWALGV